MLETPLRRRDAPRLLDYLPTYNGFIIKNPDTMPPVRKPKDLDALTAALMDRAAEASKLRSPSREARDPTAAKAPAPPKRSAPAGTEQPERSKRSRTEAGGGPGNVDPPEPHPAEKAQEPKGKEKMVDVFVPNLMCPDGGGINVADSVAENPFLAPVLLQGLGLPNDVAALPKNKARNAQEVCVHLVQVFAGALSINSLSLHLNFPNANTLMPSGWTACEEGLR